MVRGGFIVLLPLRADSAEMLLALALTQHGVPTDKHHVLREGKKNKTITVLVGETLSL